MKTIIIIVAFVTLNTFAKETVKPAYYWGLDEKDGTVLKAGAGDQDGELKAQEGFALPKRIKGMKGKALSFLKDMRSAAVFGNVKIAKNFTIMCYYKPQCHSRFLILHQRVGSYTKLRSGFNLIKWWSGQIVFEVVDTNGKVYSVKTPQYSVIQDKAPWYHIAVSKDDKSLKIYVNSSLVGQTKFDKDFRINVRKYSKLIAGRHAFKYSHTQASCLDEIKIFDQALTAEQILNECVTAEDDDL
jgi:hypothetical protein